jgi:hypothetical protein
MDYGDIIRLIVFGFIILSFLSGVFGKSDDKKKAAQPKPARPTELSQSGGQVPPRPVIVTEPAGPTMVFAGGGASRVEAPARAPQVQDLRDTDRPPLERDLRDTDRPPLERDITDMPSIAEYFDPEHRPVRRRQQEVQRRPRIVEGGDVLRHSLKDPSTLERAFIVKEVLDRPLALRDDR